MTDIQARIRRVMELDKDRSPSNWKAYPWKGTHGYEDDSHGYYVQSNEDIIVGYNRAIDAVPQGDAEFIAAAPEMVSIIKEIQAQLSAKDALIAELQKENKTLIEKLKECSELNKDNYQKLRQEFYENVPK